MTIDDVRSRLRTAALNKDEIHELDTIERFIIPIIEIAGWDINSIDPMYLKRGNRDNTSSNRRFDIALYCPREPAIPRFVFECKKLSENITILGKGSSTNTSDDSDYIRQLRNDCLNPKFKFGANWTIPILSNGVKWIIFKEAFTDTVRATENFTTNNVSDFIAAEADLDEGDFEAKIVTKLHPRNIPLAVDYDA